jgi:hypothetical protein
LRELSLHILDIVENGITAGADTIHILVEEARTEDLLTIKIRDNGRGMPTEKLNKIADPFVTSRKTRRVGLGLSLLSAAAERCDGELEVKTETGKGTEIKACFRYSHIDRAPIGDMAATVATLLMGNPDVDFKYSHIINANEFIFDTKEIRAEMADLVLTDPVVIQQLMESIRKALANLVREKENGNNDN